MSKLESGEYTIQREGNLLIIDAQGPFDEAIAKQYHQDMINITDNFNGAFWASLVTYRGNGIFPPEAERSLIETTAYRVQRGLIATAAVIIESNQADLQQMQLRRIYQNYRIPFHVFSDVENARSWLENYLSTRRTAS